MKATQHLIETGEQDRSIVILTDSLSIVAGTIIWIHWNITSTTCRITTVFCLRKTMWCSLMDTRTCIPGNRYNLQKKVGSYCSHIILCPTMKQKHILNLALKNSGKKKWWLLPPKDSIHNLTRKEQTTIFRLRTGHCGLNKHMKRIGVADTANCQCGAEEADYSSLSPKLFLPGRYFVRKYGAPVPPFITNYGEIQKTYKKLCSLSLHLNNRNEIAMNKMERRRRRRRRKRRRRSEEEVKKSPQIFVCWPIPFYPKLIYQNRKCSSPIVL